MADGINLNVDWKGLEVLLRHFDAAPAQAQKACTTAMKTTLNKAEAVATQNVRVDTGHLKQSIAVRIVKSGRDQVIGELSDNADYAAYNEFGTYKMSAQPFIRPGVTAGRGLFLQAVRKALEDSVK